MKPLAAFLGIALYASLASGQEPAYNFFKARPRFSAENVHISYMPKSPFSDYQRADETRKPFLGYSPAPFKVGQARISFGSVKTKQDAHGRPVNGRENSPVNALIRFLAGKK